MDEEVKTLLKAGRDGKLRTREQMQDVMVAGMAAIENLTERLKGTEGYNEACKKRDSLKERCVSLTA